VPTYTLLLLPHSPLCSVETIFAFRSERGLKDGVCDAKQR
jgi:hypothetical protein